MTALSYPSESVLFNSFCSAFAACMAFTTSHIIVATTAPMASQAFAAAALLKPCCALPAAVNDNFTCSSAAPMLSHILGRLPTNAPHPFVAVKYNTRIDAIGSITCAIVRQFSITDFTRLIIVDIVLWFDLPISFNIRSIWSCKFII